MDTSIIKKEKLLKRSLKQKKIVVEQARGSVSETVVSGPCRSERCRIKPYLSVSLISILDLVLFEFFLILSFYHPHRSLAHENETIRKGKITAISIIFIKNSPVSKLVAESVIASILGLCHEQNYKILLLFLQVYVRNQKLY